ncbi:Cyclic di-GMP phosphodiesterase response regulator RpfG [Lignipirellula cremea]|uniref:Cyclic di-GMP phosphodiesterase response regulator RpfG n=1 Tax=Lignipirellula cremea TaxID=2528010 RepID=A0A518E4K7_9BACT|nr:Cyclic di-GMP phosphodiesterase response regulator RpfG [Lignipirellula cremea]
MPAGRIDANPGYPPSAERRDRPARRVIEAHPGTIMIVDDEPINIKVVQKYLGIAGYENFITTSDSSEAMEIIRSQRPDVLLLDIMMPCVSGLDLLDAVRGDLELAHLPVLFLTATTDEHTKACALELGATDFLNKPVKPTELVPRVRNALVLKAHHDQMAAYSKRLEQEVQQRTAELVRSHRDIIRVLACAGEYRDRVTGNHVLRVGRFAGVIARRLGYSSHDAETIEQAAILHDVGKIGIPDDILHKPGRLNAEEMAHMQLHCEYGMNILRGAPSSENSMVLSQTSPEHLTLSPVLRAAATITMSHHEKWDGSGYPLGLTGEEIPLEGRITAVADVFDALSTRRPYKDPMPLERCCEILEEGRGQHFDPQVLDAFFAGLEEIAQIALEMAD